MHACFSSTRTCKLSRGEDSVPDVDDADSVLKLTGVERPDDLLLGRTNSVRAVLSLSVAPFRLHSSCTGRVLPSPGGLTERQGVMPWQTTGSGSGQVSPAPGESVAAASRDIATPLAHVSQHIPGSLTVAGK